jgi:RNA polymerase sigma-70 factor (ECF subfamily)
MEPETAELELTRIQTMWTVVRQAHEGDTQAVAAAQQQLLYRYGKAVQRYLLGALRSPEAAEELAQEFALRFLRGDFHRADPQRGRFRDFVKTILIHLVTDYYRDQRRRPRLLPAASLEAATPASAPPDADRLFRDSWRDELLSRSWKALAQLQERTGQPFHSVLWQRAQQPQLRSAALAGQLSATLGKLVNAAWVRQTLHRARHKFGQFLLNEVVHTMDNPTAQELEQELGELGLLEYCRPALDAFDKSGGAAR